MELDYLKEFIAAAELCNFFETSEKMFISQSSLSRHMKSLEDSLGISLFERTPRSMKLNRYGEIFLTYAKQMVQLDEECRRVLELEQEATEDTIKVSTINSSGNYHITNAFARFKSEYPDYQMNIHEADSTFSLEMLRKGECDFAFVIEAGNECVGFERIPFTTDELVAVLPSVHPLVGMEHINIKLLKSQPLLLFGKNSFIYKICMVACEKEHMEPKVVFTSYRSETLIDMVKKKMGIALMLKKEAEGYMTPELNMIPIEPEVKVNVSLIYRKESDVRKIDQCFVNCIKSMI